MRPGELTCRAYLVQFQCETGPHQGGHIMPKNRYTPEEIIQHLRTVDLETSKGVAVIEACRKPGITEQRCGRNC